MTETIQYDPSKDHCDVVIVGAGAAGAIVAHQFAEQGLKVIILEAGPKFGNDKAANSGGTEYHLDRFFAAILFPSFSTAYDLA